MYIPWFHQLNKHVDLLDFLHEIALKENSEEIEHKIAFIAEKRTDEKFLHDVISQMHEMDGTEKDRVFWYVSCIKRQSMRRKVESLLLTWIELDNEIYNRNIIELLLKIGHVENKLLLFEKFSKFDFKTKMLILKNLENNLDLRHVPFLLQVLEDQDWQIRLKTIEILTIIGDTKIVEPIIIKLDDPHVTIVIIAKRV